MSFVRKITGLMLAASIFSIFLAPAALAQSSQDPLAEIKSRLEIEGIAVVDYSSPEGKWGSLPSEWIKVLSKDYDDLKELAEKIEYGIQRHYDCQTKFSFRRS